MTGCASTGPSGVNGKDQRGVTRPGATCDIGAFQSQGFVLTKTSGDLQSVPINTAFAPLVVTVTANQAGAPYNEPVNGGMVTFTGPASGAGIVTSPVTVTIASGQASITPTANGTAGANYAVTVTTAGAPSVSFTLTNTGLGGAVTHLTITGVPSSPAGQDYLATVTAKDASETTVPSYTGTVKVTTNDPNAAYVIPAHIFVAADNGTFVFRLPITLITEGTDTITAMDTGTPTITGTLAVSVTGPAVFSTTQSTTAVTPISGPVTGGTTLTIKGAGFTGASVTVGGVACAGVQVNAQGTSLTCVTGAHVAATVDVTVTTATGSYTAPGAYTFGTPGNAPTGNRPGPAPVGGPPAPLPPGAPRVPEPVVPGPVNPAPGGRP